MEFATTSRSSPCFRSCKGRPLTTKPPALTRKLDLTSKQMDWGQRFERTFFDVKIFNPLAKSCPREIKEAYKYHENIKKLKYEDRIREVENSSFNPIVFAYTGGAGPSPSRKSWQKKLASRRKRATQTPSPTSALQLDSPLLRVLRSA